MNSKLVLPISIQNIQLQTLKMSSIIQLNSVSIKNETNCGYCNGAKSNKLWVTSGFYCYKMKLDEYQQLMDRGWRRCGVYYYRPALAQSCCQAYALRVDTQNFKHRVTHEKVLKKIKRIQPIQNDLNDLHQKVQLKSEIKEDQFTQSILSQIQTDIDTQDLVILSKVGLHFTFKSIQYKEEEHIKQFKQIIINNLSQITIQELSQVFLITNDEHQNILLNFFRSSLQEFSIYEITVFRGQINKVENEWGFGCNFIPYFYSKLQTKFKSLYPQFQTLEENKEYIQLISKYLSNIDFIFKVSQWDNQILIKTPQTIKEKIFKSTVLYYLQKADVQNTQNQVKEKKNHQIEIKWVKAQFQEDSFEVYKRYQKAIHDKERVSKQSYLNFVCVDALDSKELGCWHMKYYLDNQLIAVGVVDLLPQSLSSVYFFYDPAYKKYSLGVYGVLQEIEYIKQHQKENPQLKYYYMGFYIMDSKKMAYKADYTPCELLCPQTYRWIPLSKQIKEKIKKITEYAQDVRLAEEKGGQLGYSINLDGSTIIDMDFSDVDIQNFILSHIKISQAGKQYSISQLKKNYQQYFMNLFENLLGKIGKQLMTEFLFAVN
ncbi:unnamed protein product [Paramecium primaurelia]|uniref:Arginyl-tRNA--protein transferase 1 n=1 Tax=Paramecium primaurelia TaxID=5886 RepID=A0A8S1PH72_PARPR|nr:unnamed protein product [Paramecium primaurelia]